jgi:two-component system OmpR family response regulator
MRVLVVDDETSLGEVMIRALKGAGIDAAYVCNGPDAVRSVTSRGADVVVVDMHMSGMDGLELIQRLRRLRPKTQILAMSGGDKTGNKSMLMISTRLGAHAVLRKPFTLSELVAKVRELAPSPKERV